MSRDDLQADKAGGEAVYGRGPANVALAKSTNGLSVQVASRELARAPVGHRTPVLSLKPAHAALPRPTVQGPFLWSGDRKLVVKAVTYGSFAPDLEGNLFPPRSTVQRDLRAMRSANVNALRTYTPPPDWLLEEARAAGMKVLVGIHWEASSCTFEEPGSFREASAAVRDAVSRCRRFPDVVLGYAIGNEIPPLVIRFHGPRVIERFLQGLYEVAKREDPEGLVTYATYPSTEYLELDFLDFLTINVYLLEPAALSRYLDRVLMHAKGKPVLLGEVGEDSLRKGEEHQAAVLEWTIPLAFDKGVAGVCVFGWTDDWVVGGHRITDWKFGLVDAERRPKLALDVVYWHFGRSPLTRSDRTWPRVSVIVCNYNGGATLDETLSSLTGLDYPDYEVIYVDDGSTDDSLEIAQRYAPRIKVLAQENRGLGVARNVGAEAATGDIVAYIDSDAYADKDWLRYLVLAMESGGYAAAGGPNLTPPADGLMAQFIAACPGNPTCVLMDDVRADHVAGVNMAFRRKALLSIGGFDSIHRKAGDDVDVCWRLLDADHEIAFAPAAVVWHHRRPSILRYLKQQFGYGEAENQLANKHPERFNIGGYIRWNGRVYQAPRKSSSLFRSFIYHGTFGNALFQTLYQRDPSCLMSSPTMIHWYLAWSGLFLLSLPYPWLLPAALGMFLLSLWAAFVQGLTVMVPVPLSRRERVLKVCVITLLHFVHPLVRWAGRVGPGPRDTVANRGSIGTHSALSEIRHLARRKKQVRRYWVSCNREATLCDIQRELKRRNLAVARGCEWSTFDLHLNGTLGAKASIHSAEEHYGQALCFGLVVSTPLPARMALMLSIGVGCIATTASVWGLALFLLPALLEYHSLVRRCRLRHESWEAIEAVMKRAGGQRCDLKEGA